MRVTLRALSVATGLLWLFIGLFLATTIYSAMQIRIEEVGVSLPQVEGAALYYNITITIYNGGFYDIRNLTITTTMILNLTGDLILSTSSMLPAIGKGERGTLVHVVVLDLAAVQAENATVFRILMLNNSDITVVSSIGLLYAYTFWTELSTNFTAAWGAPLSGMRVWAYGLSGNVFSFNMTFVNSSPMSYSFWVEVLNDRGEVVGTSSPVDVAPGYVFEGQVSVLVDPGLWTVSGTIVAHLDVEGTHLSLPVVEYHV